MQSNQDYKNAALAALRGNWAPSLVATVVFILITLAFTSPSAFMDPVNNPGLYMGVFGGTTLLAFLVSVPLQVGYYNTFKELYVTGDNEITGNMVRFGFGKYFKTLVTYLLVGLLVFLGFICFIIPGFLLAYAYLLVPYLLVDEPELSITETLKRSRLLMKGHKFDAFYLQLSFIGWAILAIFTLGIGYLWLYPYIVTATGVFYKDVAAGTAGKPSSVYGDAAETVPPRSSAPEDYMPSGSGDAN